MSSFSIAPQFGGASGLTTLVDSLHSNDFYLMQDVVANHVGGTINTIGTIKPFNEPQYYHDCNYCPSSCNIENFNDQQQVQLCRLAALPDLNQSVPFVYDQLIGFIGDLVKTYSIDGLRVDTTPEVNKPFWRAFQAAANVYAVGEVFNGDVQYVSSFQGTALPAVLSYPLFFTLRECFAQQQSLYNLQNMLQQYKQYFPDTTILGALLHTRGTC